MQSPSFPALLPTLSACYMHTMAGGQCVWGGSLRVRSLVKSVKEQNKKGVALFSYMSACCSSGDFPAWEEKLGKPTVSPLPQHVRLEKKKHTAENRSRLSLRT